MLKISKIQKIFFTGFCKNMKILLNNVNNSYSSFKGYDAVPIKNLHMGNFSPGITEELREISKKENFGVKTSKYNDSYNQDFKVILEDGGVPHLIMEQNIEIFAPHLKDIEKEYQMSAELIPMFDNKRGFISGGNFFIGKKPDGEKWMLIGKSEQMLGKGPDKISELYGVKKENIHFIPLQDYHLDLSIRPVGYPYVLVNNPKEAHKNETKIKGLKQAGKPVPYKADFKYDSYKKTVEILEKAGFIPIPIGGVYDDGINFINAVVNLHPDGTISYITNSSKSKNPRDAKYQRLFEKDLRRKLSEALKNDENAPKLQNVYFIEGELYDFGNEMTDNLLEGSGGIHCMTLEEPDFELWA